MMEREKLISLVRAVQDGKDGAAGELYDAFYDDIYYHILKTVDKDPELAADLTQDTFMEILETIGKLQEPAAFVTWSRQVAYHKCTAYFRKRRDILLDEQEDGYSAFDTLEEDRAEFIPDEALDKEDFKQTIHTMISDLPEEQRSALLLRYFNEVSVKEIAQIQGVTEGTVKSRLNYARKAIKTAVESYEKKYDIRLHCAGVVPMLLWFFRAYRRAQGMAVTAGSATAVFAVGETAAAATGTAAGTAAAKTGIFGGIKAFVQTLAGKVIAGVTAATIVVGGTAALVTQLDKKEEPVYLEKWSGYIEECARGQGREAWAPIEGSRMHVELEVLEAGEVSYDVVLQITWDDGEVYRSRGEMRAERVYDGMTGYRLYLDPLFPQKRMGWYEMDAILMYYHAEEDIVTMTRPRFSGELEREGKETSVFCRDVGPRVEMFDSINVNDDVRGLPELDYASPDGVTYRWMDPMDVLANGDAVSSIMFASIEGGPKSLHYTMRESDGFVWVRITQWNELAYEETIEFLPEIGGVPVKGIRAMGSGSVLNVKTVIVPEGIEVLDHGAFDLFFQHMTELRLPNSLRKVGSSFLGRCYGIQDICLPEGVEEVAAYAVVSCPELRQISLPSSMVRLGGAVAYGCPKLEIITVAPGNPVYHSDGNCLIETESGTLITGCKTSRIPDDGSVTAIGRYAFAGNTGVTTMTVPEHVTRIDYGAFFLCSELTEIYLPESLEHIDAQAFKYCEALTDIYFAGTVKQFKKIQDVDWEKLGTSCTVHCADGNITLG